MKPPHNHLVPGWTETGQDGADQAQASIHTRSSPAPQPSGPYQDTEDGPQDLRQTIRKLRQDIARHRETAAVFAEREARYRLLYEQNPSMYFTLDPNGVILSVNQFGATALGYRPDELTGLSVLRVFHSSDHATVLHQLDICSNSPGTIFDWEIQKIRKDGSRLWVKERARYITDHLEHPVILVVCEDITDRRTAEETARENAQRLRRATHFLDTLVQEAPLPIVSLDGCGIVTSWNQAATNLFGWTADEVMGRELPYVPPGQEAEAEALWEQGTRNMVQGPIPLRRRRKDGTLLDLLLWPVFIYDESEQLATAVGLFVDQSDLQRAEAARLRSEERLRSFLNALDDLAFELDAQGTYLNVWTRNDDKLLLPREQIVGRNMTELFGAEESARYLEAIHRVLATGRSEPVEYEVLLKGQRRCFSAIMSRIPATDRTASTVACVVRDVTDLRQAEATLRLTQTAVDRAADMAFWITPDARFLYVNDAACERLGYSRADLLTMTVSNVDPDYQMARWPSHWEELRRDKRLRFETRHRSKAGEIYPVEVVANYVAIEGREYNFAFVRDISDRKRAEAALCVSEERFAKAFRSSPHPVIVTERDTGRCLEVNDAGLALFGYRREEVIGQTVLTLGLWPTPEERAKFFVRLAAEGTVRNIEQRFYAKDRSPRQCLVSCEPIDLNGTPCLVTVGTDITEFKRATDALHLSEQYLRSIIETSPECIKLVAADGRLLTINAAGLAMIEADRAEDVLGRSVYDLISPSHREAFQAMNERVCRGGKESLVFEVIGLRGTHRWMESHVVPLRNSADGTVAQLAIARDITARMRAEEAVRQHEQTLQRARDERERISRDLHDNILQSLYAVGLQLEASTMVVGTSTRKAKTHITRAVTQLNQLVRDVRHFIALLEKRSQPDMDFGHALRKLVASFSSTEPSAPALDIEPSAIPLIRPEAREHLLSIAREALSNSMRHAHATRRAVTLHTTTAGVQLSVYDDGIGFTPGRKGRRGQGLANMAARAKQIDARFTVTSAPGQGTCLTVEIPRGTPA